MSKKNKRTGRSEVRCLDKFGPCGESGPIDDRNEYEQRLNSLLLSKRSWQKKARALPTCASTSPSRKWTFAIRRREGGRCFQTFTARAHSRHEGHQPRTDGVPQ